MLALYLKLHVGLLFVVMFINMSIRRNLAYSALCPDDWVISDQSETCIKVSKEPLTFDLARSSCQHNGSLVTIRHKLMNQLLTGLIVFADVNSSVWIGLHKPPGAKQFQWVDGSKTLNLTFWNASEPSANKTRTCVLLTFEETWVTADCQIPYHYVCEQALVEPLCADGVNGAECQENCSQSCGKNKICYFFNGSCVETCLDGFHGNKCDAACNDGCAGPNNTCDQETGICFEGCDNGFTGATCNLTLMTTTSSDELDEEICNSTNCGLEQRRDFVAFLLNTANVIPLLVVFCMLCMLCGTLVMSCGESESLKRSSKHHLTSKSTPLKRVSLPKIPPSRREKPASAREKESEVSNITIASIQTLKQDDPPTAGSKALQD